MVRKMKLGIVLAIIGFSSPLVAEINKSEKSEAISYKGECYVFNKDKGEYILKWKKTYNVQDLSINDIINKLSRGVEKTVDGYGCDRYIVYYTTPQPDTTEGVTIQKMAKPINPISKADFVTVKQAKSSYFVGISNKLQGAGVGYWIYRDDEIGKNKTIKHVFGIERVNWLNFFAKYIKEYCNQTNGIPPYIIYNQMAFLNAAGTIGEVLKKGENPTYSPDVKKALKNPGFFKLPQDICQESVKDIEDDLSEIRTYSQHGSKGYNYNLYSGDSDKLFEDNGFIINYPYIDFKHIDQIMGEFFSTFMFVNNIPRGVMFTNDKIQTQTKHWTTGKWPWSKKIHSRRKWNTSSSSYDIIYAQFIQPFGSYSFTKDWSNIDLSYVASVNNLPALTRQLIMLTPDNHQITHIFKKGGEISDIGKWSYQKEVERKLGLNFVKFIIAVSAVGLLAYTGALFFTSGLAAGGVSFGTYLSFVTTYPSALIGGLIGGGGLIGSIEALGIATGTMAGASTLMNGSWFYKKVDKNSGDNSVFNKISKQLTNDVITSSSIRIQQIQILPKMLEIEPKDMVSPSVYRIILQYTPTLNKSDRVIPESEFLTDYGTYFNMFMYANHTDLGKDFYSQNDVRNWAKSFINNMEIKSTGGFMNPRNALITIMQREFNGN